MQKIIVSIDPMGNPKVEAEGFVGSSCEAATKPIEDMLAGKGGGDRTYKPEYSQTAEQEQQATW